MQSAPQNGYSSAFPAASTSIPSPRPGLVPPQLPVAPQVTMMPTITNEEKQDKKLVGFLIVVVVFAVVAIVVLLFLLSRFS